MVKHSNIKRIVVGELEVNCYVVWNENTLEAFVIDPGDEFLKIDNFLKSKNLSVKAVINTHGHGDHIGADGEFGSVVYIHKDDEGCLIDPCKNLSMYFFKPIVCKVEHKIINDGDVLDLAGMKLTVIHTPGHTRGCVCFLYGDVLFSGDTLFFEAIGRTDLPGGNFKDIVQSIKGKLFILPDDVIVCPGHGGYSTIGHEKKSNSFLK